MKPIWKRLKYWLVKPLTKLTGTWVGTPEQ